jgi:hypothetical protein
VASLFYLVPPLTAIEAYLLFGERLGALALAVMALAMLGVALVLRRRRAYQVCRLLTRDERRSTMRRSLSSIVCRPSSSELGLNV